jgi:hypothetical protein
MSTPKESKLPHGFYRSDSRNEVPNSFFDLTVEDRVQWLRILMGYGMACLAPMLIKANGAGHAEGPSGAEVSRTQAATLLRYIRVSRGVS